MDILRRFYLELDAECIPTLVLRCTRCTDPIKVYQHRSGPDIELPDIVEAATDHHEWHSQPKPKHVCGNPSCEHAGR
jgi:hypothetical protein